MDALTCFLSSTELDNQSGPLLNILLAFWQ